MFPSFHFVVIFSSSGCSELCMRSSTFAGCAPREELPRTLGTAARESSKGYLKQDKEKTAPLKAHTFIYSVQTMHTHSWFLASLIQ